MGHKKVCLECRVTFNRPFDGGSELSYPCSECAKPMIHLSHRFRPPKKSDDKKWEVVKYLIGNGFYYQHIYENVENKNGIISHQSYVAYPSNMRDAKEFVEKFKGQSRKLN